MSQVFEITNQTSNVSSRYLNIYWDNTKKVLVLSAHLNGMDLNHADSNYIRYKLSWWNSLTNMWVHLETFEIDPRELRPNRYTEIIREYNTKSEFIAVKASEKFNFEIKDENNVESAQKIKYVTLDLTPTVNVISPTTPGLSMNSGGVVVDTVINIGCDVHWECKLNPKVEWSDNLQFTPAGNVDEKLFSVLTLAHDPGTLIAMTGGVKHPGKTTLKDSEIKLNDSKVYLDEIHSFMCPDADMHTIDGTSTEGKKLYYRIDFQPTTIDSDYGGGGGS